MLVGVCPLPLWGAGPDCCAALGLGFHDFVSFAKERITFGKGRFNQVIPFGGACASWFLSSHPPTLPLALNLSAPGGQVGLLCPVVLALCTPSLSCGMQLSWSQESPLPWLFLEQG